MSQSNSQTNLTSMIESAIRTEQKGKLATILKHVSKLSDMEKFYLYLKLPTGQTLDEPRNVTPVSSVNRTSTTLKWIRSQYVEDKDVCVPKQEMYHQYSFYCEATNINAVGSADFGKMVKSAFPNIHHRRLGQRGKSKAYYGGLKRRTQVEMPTLPVVEAKPSENPEVVPNPLQEMQNLSSQLICEWACRLFDKKFIDIKSLAQYLVQTGASYGKKAALFSMMYDSCGVPSRVKETKSSDHRLQDTQALLQRKLHQKEVLKEHMKLLKVQKNQRAAASSVIPGVGNQDMAYPQHGVVNPTSSHNSAFASDMPSSNLTAPISLTDSGEKKTKHTFTRVGGMSNSNNLVVNGVCRNKESGDLKSPKKYSQHCLRENSMEGQEREKSPEKLSSFHEHLSHMSVSSDSDVSRQSPQTNLGLYDHKQQKRMGDMLSGPCHGRVSKRRRCMTSLGVPHEEFMEDLTVGGESADHAGIQRIRPISCPTLHDVLSLGSSARCVNKSSSKDNIALRKRQTSNHCREKGSYKSKEKLRNFNHEDWSQKKSSTSVRSTSEVLDHKSKSDKSSFHFVQKPTVIAVRQPGTLFPSVMSCPNLGSSQKFEPDSQDSPSDIKKTHNILNTLLSSDTNSLSKPDLPSQASLTSPLPLSVQQLDDLDARVNQQGQKLPHTLDNAYILSALLNRSAFVPVASNKLQDLSRSRSSHPCLSIYSSSRSSSNEKQDVETKNSSFVDESDGFANDVLGSSEDEAMKETSLQKENIAKTTHSPISQTTSPQTHVTKCLVADTQTSDHFKPITYSKFQVSTSTSSVINQSSVTPTPVISSSPVLHSKTFVQNLSNSSNPPCVTKQLNKVGTKSPVTPPRRQSRSRFTPIRPKINGYTPSPQKKDMRPVSMILKEQRVRNTQELLVNLANTYQGEVKLQMPAELLGLSPASKSRSSDVLVTIGTPAGVPIRQASARIGVSPNKEIKVILDPRSQSTPTSTTTTSSFSTVTSNANPQLGQSNLLVSNVDQCQGNTGLQSQIHPCKAVNGVNENQTDTFTTNSQSVIVSSKSNLDADYNHQDAKLVIADNKGAIYTLDGDGQPFPLPHNVKNVLQTDGSNSQGHNSSAKAMHNVINIADINGHVIGPDNTGQAYLLVPSSESTSDVQSKTTTVTKSSGEAPSTPVACSVSEEVKSLIPSSKGNQDSIQALPSSIKVSSSSALLSKLSQLASKQEKTQTPIQHNSALSAFHKCAPNKQATKTSANTRGSHFGVEPAMPVASETSTKKLCHSDHVVVPLPESVVDADVVTVESSKLNSKEQVNSRCHSVRKRKASKSREVGMKDTKRQNTSERDGKYSEDDDVVIVDVEKQSSNPGGKLCEDALTKRVKQTESPCLREESLDVQEKTDIDFSDTEALLQRINGSRSLTVKQTVMAINSLKAEMKKKLQDSNVCPSSDLLIGPNLQQIQTGDMSSLASQQPSSQFTKVCDRTGGKNVNRSSSCTAMGLARDGLLEGRQMSRQVATDKQRSIPKTLCSNKRNMSLNVESLESDALLDNEPTLDQRLVVDVGESTKTKSDNKTSVAVVARTSQSLSSSLALSKQEGFAKKSHRSRSTYTISADTLRSYQMILNEKKASDVTSVDSNMSKKSSVESHAAQMSKRLSHVSYASSTSATRAPSLPRRSLSCVRDILERGTSSVLEPLKQDKSHLSERTSGVEYFDALLSKIQSKSEEAMNSDSGAEPKSQAGCDLDIPIDVVDFVTESMSSRGMYNVPSARSLSVPNTRPDFFNLLDPVVNVTSDKTGNVTREYSMLFLDQGKGSQSSDKTDEGPTGHSDEQGSSDKQNVFLSPVGPAKLARRLSVEKSVIQPTVDRSMVKTPVEFSSPMHSSEASSPIKLSSGMKSHSGERQSARTPVDRGIGHVERKRAKTPFDATLPVQTSDKKGGKSGLRSQSQSSEEIWSSKAPVSRSLTQTPMDKFFHKMVSESLISKYQLENLNQQYSRDQLSGSDEFSSSQTPTSDAGYSSISETPISDFGYNSISPSPVMMSSSSFFGECGRRDITSPATIFMPLRSDSALSLNNTVNAEYIAFPPQANLTDILPSVSNQFGENFSDEPDQSEKATSVTHTSLTHLQDRLSSLSSSSSQADHLHLQRSLEKEDEPNEFRNCHDIPNSLDFTKLVSLHNIPTPPFSPNSTPMSTAAIALSPAPFSIPFSPLPNHESSPSPTSVPRFLLPSSTGTPFPNFLHSSSPPRYSCPLDQPSPSIAHVLTPSPHILARPPSSPHNFGTHPSPPFTPSSQRSLPSPCPTVLSFKSLISPRSLTPSVDCNQAPNGFMPIQSSYVQTASLAPTHTYIQPIKPVVTLASPSSHKAGDEYQVHTSTNSSSGVLLPSSIGMSHEGKKHSHGRCTPSTSVLSGKKNHQFISYKPVKTCGSDQLSLSSQECVTSKYRNISPHSDMAGVYLSQGSKGQGESPVSRNSHGLLMSNTYPLSANKNLMDSIPSLQQLRNADSHALLDHKNPLNTMQRSLIKSEDQNSDSNHNVGNTLTLIQSNNLQSSVAKAFHAADNSCRSTRFSHRKTLYPSPSDTPVITQTDSLFTAVPSKLQVDLTKLETSQNPTSTIQSKPFKTSRCKINLDSCENLSTLHIGSLGQGCSSSITSSSTSCPRTMPFDIGGKDLYQNSRYEALANVDTSADNLWNERPSKSSCQDDLQATLEVLKGMDSQYFPSDEDNSNTGSPSGS